MSIYGQTIVLLACYSSMHICMNETHNKKYSTPLATDNKISFFFECPVAKKTICSFSETANEVISIKVV